MNTTIRNTALAALLFAAASGAAFAADSADLTVKGVIKPSICNVALPDGGVIDFGTITASSLSATNATPLTEKWLDFTITCDSAAKVAAKVIDNRSGTASLNDVGIGGQAYKFGFGEQSGKKLGAYTITATPYSTVDGAYVNNSTNILASTDNGKTWTRNAASARADGSSILALNAAGGDSPAAGKVFKYSLRVNGAIESTSNLPALTTDISLDGNATFTVIYL
ncbi:DUF1120 domain-containing protein [Cupriavidus pauculus]|nr:DUF1120 domain-containing protein [Cupriavidus pauculus]